MERDSYHSAETFATVTLPFGTQVYQTIRDDIDEQWPLEAGADASVNIIYSIQDY
jgi:hypothetical protein